MGNLTSYDKDMGILVNEEESLLNSRGFIDKDEMYKIMRHLAEKLYEYERLEEKGLLAKLPCKVGAIVYKLLAEETNRPTEIKEMRVVNILLEEQYIYFTLQSLTGKPYCTSVSSTEFGKIVFLTQEDAEKAIEA